MNGGDAGTVLETEGRILKAEKEGRFSKMEG
jgi:hypothetical protein